jgi:hypothetical protein
MFRYMHGLRVGRATTSLALLLMAFLLVGCGGGSKSDDATLAIADSPAGAKIEAASPAERKIGSEVQDYLERNCALPGAIEKVPAKEREDPRLAAVVRGFEGMEAMCGHIASISVDGTRVTIRSEIEPGEERGAGEAFCNLIRGSDVADETPGHELQNVDGSTIAVCPAGDDPPVFR